MNAIASWFIGWKLDRIIKAVDKDLIKFYDNYSIGQHFMDCYDKGANSLEMKMVYLSLMKKHLNLKSVIDCWNHEEARKDKDDAGFWLITFHDESMIMIKYEEKDMMTHETFYDHIAYMTYKHWLSIMDKRIATWK